MSSCERVITSLNFEEPDMMPITEFLIDNGVYTAIMPAARQPYDFDGEIGFDVLAVRADADIIVETDDYAFNNGPLMSPEMFDLFIPPG